MTANARGLITAISAATCAPAWSALRRQPNDRFGFGIADALTEQTIVFKAKPAARGSSRPEYFAAADVGDANYTITATDRGVNLTTTLTAVPHAHAASRGNAVNRASRSSFLMALVRLTDRATISVARCRLRHHQWRVTSVSLSTQYAVAMFISMAHRSGPIVARSGGGGGSGTVANVSTGTEAAGRLSRQAERFRLIRRPHRLLPRHQTRS